jgi:branched-chain amino acid transport system permease protein
MTYISPDFFSIWESMTMLLIVVIGGSGSVTGVILGAVLLIIVPEIGREAKRVEPIIFGTILVVVLRFLPGGLRGLLSRILWRLKFFKNQ